MKGKGMFCEKCFQASEEGFSFQGAGMAIVGRSSGRPKVFQINIAGEVMVRLSL